MCCLVLFLDPLSYWSTLPGMISRFSVVRKYLTWYDFRISSRKKVYDLVWFQNSLEKVYRLVCGQVFVFLRKSVAWYELRIPCLKKGDCLVWCHDTCLKNVSPWVHDSVLLFYGCLRMSVYSLWHCLQRRRLWLRWLMARTASKLCARTRSECSRIVWSSWCLNNFWSHRTLIKMWCCSLAIMSHVSLWHFFLSSSAMCLQIVCFHMGAVGQYVHDRPCVLWMTVWPNWDHPHQISLSGRLIAILQILLFTGVSLKNQHVVT